MKNGNQSASQSGTSSPNVNPFLNICETDIFLQIGFGSDCSSCCDFGSGSGYDCGFCCDWNEDFYQNGSQNVSENDGNDLFLELVSSEIKQKRNGCLFWNVYGCFLSCSFFLFQGLFFYNFYTIFGTEPRNLYA